MTKIERYQAVVEFLTQNNADPELIESMRKEAETLIRNSERAKIKGKQKREATKSERDESPFYKDIGEKIMAKLTTTPTTLAELSEGIKTINGKGVLPMHIGTAMKKYIKEGSVKQVKVTVTKTSPATGLDYQTQVTAYQLA